MPLPDTPFLDVLDRIPPLGGNAAPFAAEIPFVPAWFGQETELQQAEVEAVSDLLEQLHDGDFDSSVLRLVDAAQARADRVLAETGSSGRNRAESAVVQWLQPLATVSEMVLDQMARQIETAEMDGLSSLAPEELEAALDASNIAYTTEDPIFEDFIGKLIRKAKTVAKTAIKVAKKGIAAVGKVLPIGMVLRQLVRLIRPLLDRVLKVAIDKLPPALRQPASDLAKKLLGKANVRGEQEDGNEPTHPAGGDVFTAQQELDSQMLRFILSPTPAADLLVAQSRETQFESPDNSIVDLDEARERLVVGLLSLDEGEDPTPLVEQFLPAVLPVLRTALTIVGRSKVVSFLAKHLGRVIAPLVGPKLTPILSQAIVDAGLRLMTLEAPEQLEELERLAPDPQLLAEALAFFVEDAATEVLTRTTDDEISSSALLEATTMDAIERAASAAFPTKVLQTPRGAVAGIWVPMPRRGPRRYRRFSKSVNLTLQPKVAEHVRTRSGRSLAALLVDRLGNPGPVRTRIHLVEALPGATAGRILRGEQKGTPPAVPSEFGGELLPLTREAAGVLLGDPNAGRDVDEVFLADDGPMALGQRFYMLEVLDGPSLRARPGSSALSGINIRKQPEGGLLITLRVSESLSQRLAVLARRSRQEGALLRAVAPLLKPVPGWQQQQSAVAAAYIVLRHSLATHLQSRRTELIEAAAAPEEGMTLTVRARAGARLGELKIRPGQHDD